MNTMSTQKDEGQALSCTSGTAEYYAGRSVASRKTVWHQRRSAKRRKARGGLCTSG